MTRLSTRLSLTSFARASTWGVVLVGLVPARAFACAVCGGGNPANRFAFFASTIALSLLPLGLFAAGFLWLRARRSSTRLPETTENRTRRQSRRPDRRNPPPSRGPIGLFPPDSCEPS